MYRRRPNTFQLTSRTVLMLLMFIALGASTIYWWGVQSALVPGNTLIALAFTAVMVLAPPALVSFLIPWSPAGMLLQKVNARTWGYVVVVGCSIYLLYYSFQIQWAWWAAQQVVAESGLIWQQVFIGLIGFIIIPALLWTPVSSDELVEQVRQAHLVKRYELQTQADIAILRSTLLRAQEKALVGFANLTLEEREELSVVMKALVGGIDQTLREVGQTVKTVSGVALPFDGILDDNEDIRDVLEFISESLTDSTLHVIDQESEPSEVGNGPPTQKLERLPSRNNVRPPVRFVHPRTNEEMTAPLIDWDPFGNAIVESPDGTSKRVRKEWIVSPRKEQ